MAKADVCPTLLYCLKASAGSAPASGSAFVPPHGGLAGDPVGPAFAKDAGGEDEGPAARRSPAPGDGEGLAVPPLAPLPAGKGLGRGDGLPEGGDGCGGEPGVAGLLPGLSELSGTAPGVAAIPPGAPGGLGWGVSGDGLLLPVLLPELPLVLVCGGLLTFATKSAYVRSWPAIWRGMVPTKHSARATKAMFPHRVNVEPRLQAHAQQAALPPMGLQNPVRLRG